MMPSETEKKSSNEGLTEGALDDCSLKALVHAILSPKRRKPPFLKELYRLSDLFSSHAQRSSENAVSDISYDIDSVICLDGIELKVGEIHELSSLIFNELENHFDRCLSSLSGDVNIRECSSVQGLYHVVEVVNWLLRCCLVQMALLSASHVDFVLEKCQILLQILAKVSLLNLTENSDEKQAFAFSPNPLLFFKCMMIEVFIDELLTREELRQCFKGILSTYESHVPHSNFAQLDRVVAEAVCNHFILVFSKKQALRDIFSILFCSNTKEHRYPSILCVKAAALLLCNPIMISAPKYMQAHLISLVSNAIESSNSELDHKLINYFMSVFEKPVNIYMKLMPWLRIDGYSEPSCNFSYPSFESHIPPDTRNKVLTLINGLDSYSDLHMHGASSNIVSSSMRFLKETENSYDISLHDEIFSILSCLIVRASESVDDTATHQIDCNNLENVYLLASSLKLMSVALMQTVSYLRNGDDSLRILKDFKSCKEYDFISHTISCFSNLDDFSSPMQHFLRDKMSSTRLTNSTRMFLHFSGLMSLSFASGLDCFVKASLLIVVAVLNLCVFEEGNLDSFKSILDDSQKDKLAVVEFQEVVLGKNSAFVVGSRFQEIRSRVLEKVDDEMDNAGAVLEKMNNGEVFFKCLYKTGQTTSDFDDLIDFVKVESEVDIKSWLSNRGKYRKRKLVKKALLRWKRKKKCWKTLVRKRI